MSWQNEEKIYVVMFQSEKSGGTYTELRKTEAGKNRLVETLLFMGYRNENIIVTEQMKAWKPDLRKNGKRKKVTNYVDATRIPEKSEEAQLLDGREERYLQ